MASDLGSDGSALELDETSLFWALVVSCDRGHPCSTPSHPSLAIKTNVAVPCQARGDQREDPLCFPGGSWGGAALKPFLS